MWLDDMKGDGVRSRLVAMQFNRGEKRYDTFSAAPGRKMMKVVVSRAATRRKKAIRPTRQIGLWDANVAFFQADLGTECFAVRLPKGLAPPGYVGQLKRTMYGTQRAIQLFQDTAVEVFDAGG